MPGAAPAPAPEAIEERNLQAEEHKLALVREMRIIGGPARAYALWRKLGLADAEPELPAAGPAAVAFDPEAAIAAVRSFIQENGARFVPSRQPGNPATWAARGVAGFIAANGDILLLAGTWRTVLAGQNLKRAADALAAAGFLTKGPKNERCRAERIGVSTMRVYRVAGTILTTAPAG